MAKDKNEVAVVENKTPARRKKEVSARAPANVTMEQVFMEAIRMPDLIPENLEKILALKERMDKTAAENAFNVAMSEFQGKIGVIVGTKDGSKTKDGKVVFKYAPRDQIMPVIRKPLADCGLSVAFQSELGEKIRKTTCTVTHVMGHSRSAVFESERADGTSLMSNLQKHSATLEHHQRYALKMALNIVTSGEDDEDQLKNENGKETKKVTKAQVKILENAIGSDDESLYKSVTVEYQVTSLEDIPANKFKNCKERIETYKKKKKERQQAKKEQTNMELAT